MRHARRFLLLVAGLFFGVCLTAGADASRIVLVTGFEPFGGDATNGSWEAVQHLDGKHLGNATVVVAQLPVVWGKAETKLRALIKLHKPVLVVGFGQASDEPVRLETTAHNVHEKIADNEGVAPETGALDELGPAALNSALPLAEIENRLRKAGIPVKFSDDAGTYLCNAAFYTLMLDPGTDDAKSIPRGFVHVPPLNAKVKSAQGKTVVFDKALLEKTAALIVETSVAALSRVP
ncbi:MAG: pyroglutamyl-peptidase I [Gammaproteobacteria bacterium]|nr:pyroglutamyl-peptidase I [Gammaproteobacteria bacterium]